MADSPFEGKLFLAPLTRGGHLAFRRLCVEFGAEVTTSEMVVVRRLLGNRTNEFALLKHSQSEPFFGVQLAERSETTLAEGARIAESRGAKFVDLNCGCPIHEITRRGLGASLLRKPRRLGKLVEALRSAVGIPVTVKLRTGWSESEVNVAEVARVSEESGAAAITIHARTRNQRYSRSADWDLISRIRAERRITVVGNGDILTHFEARERKERSLVSSLMLARGALIKPWLFREIREGRDLLLTPEERVKVLYRFVELLRDHFGDGERGKKRILYFLPWHLDFLSRYRPLPEEAYLEAARRHPLLQTRIDIPPGAGREEILLADPRGETHALLSEELLEARSHEEAWEGIQELARRVDPPASLEGERRPIEGVSG